jgi:hypothetical protein
MYETKQVPKSSSPPTTGQITAWIDSSDTPCTQGNSTITHGTTLCLESDVFILVSVSLPFIRSAFLWLALSMRKDALVKRPPSL